MAHKLYIIMRTDLASMNAGKACAQAAHAANHFIYMWRENMPKEISSWENDGWEDGADGFGTTVVLDGRNLSDFIRGDRLDFSNLPPRFKILPDRISDITVPTGLVFDPTYPVRDGDFTHYVKIPTCVYVFVDKDTNPEWAQFLNNFDLMR